MLEVLSELPSESVNCVVTSPPYWALRDYGAEGQLGLEPTPEEYVARMVEVFREVRRVLRVDGTCWLNLGDSYSHAKAAGNTKPKDLLGIPWLVAFALQADGWYLRADVIWSKPNPMPESVTDRPTKAHEYVFLLSRSSRYFFDQEAVREPHTFNRYGGKTVREVQKEHKQPPDGTNAASLGGRPRDCFPGSGRNIRSVWEIATQPYPEAHFATFPEELVRRCLLAGCPQDGTVIDPFAGSGTTGLVARKHGRRSILIELNPSYCELAAKRLAQLSLLAA